MKKISLVVLLLIFITLPTILPLFNSKFFYTQDYIFIARLQQMSSALGQGQFPVRWAPDLRYGEPLFNFYAPLPYYIGAAVHLLGFNFIWVAKILFMLSAFLSAVTMYLLVRRLFGQKAAIFAAILYTWAPYRAVDMYVRGSLSETWAFVFFPLIFYASLKLVEKISLRNIAFLSLSLAGLFLTHNVTTLMFLPFLLIWWLYLILSKKKWSSAPHLFLAAAVGFGLSAFFLLPAFFENNFIQTKYLTVGYFNFRAHFVAVKQFFSLFWGYGSSVWGPEDGLSFQVGLVNFAVLGLTAIFAFVNRKNKKTLSLFLVLLVSFLISIFLQHNKSAFVWEAISEMAFIQFPWRFLGITVFIVSIIGGLLTVYLKERKAVIYFLLVISVIFLNFGYFRPKEYAADSFFDKFLKVESMQKGMDLTKDYLPIWVQTTDEERFYVPRAEKGEITVSDLFRTTALNFSAKVATSSTIVVPVTYFPGWQVRANDEIIPQDAPSKSGLIRFELPKGDYRINLELKDTPVRMIGNILSIVSAVVVLVLLIFKRKISDA